MRGGGLGDGEVAHAGLHPGCARHRVELQDTVEAGKTQHDAVAERQGPAGESGPRTPGHHRHPALMAQAQDALDLRTVRGSTTSSGNWRYAESPSHS